MFTISQKYGDNHRYVYRYKREKKIISTKMVAVYIIYFRLYPCVSLDKIIIINWQKTRMLLNYVEGLSKSKIPFLNRLRQNQSSLFVHTCLSIMLVENKPHGHYRQVIRRYVQRCKNVGNSSDINRTID